MPAFTSPPNPKHFHLRVWDLVRQIPPGRVATYGQLAARIAPENRVWGARWVGGALAVCPEDVPWQRVVNAQGKISPRPGAEAQAALLRAEGVELDESGRIDLRRFGWQEEG